MICSKKTIPSQLHTRNLCIFVAYINELVASVKDDTTKHNGVADSKEEEVKKRNKKISYDSKRKNQ